MSDVCLHWRGGEQRLCSQCCWEVGERYTGGGLHICEDAMDSTNNFWVRTNEMRRIGCYYAWFFRRGTVKKILVVLLVVIPVQFFEAMTGSSW